jgi:hypothetical protein
MGTRIHQSKRGEIPLSDMDNDHIINCIKIKSNRINELWKYLRKQDDDENRYTTEVLIRESYDEMIPYLLEAHSRELKVSHIRTYNPNMIYQHYDIDELEIGSIDILVGF